MSTHRLSFKKVAETLDLPQGKLLKVKLDNKEILLANVDGKIYAVDNQCPHKKGDLSNGTLEGKKLKCPLHGSVFNVTTGKNLQGPKAMFFKEGVKNLNTYEVLVEGNDILVYQKSAWGV